LASNLATEALQPNLEIIGEKREISFHSTENWEKREIYCHFFNENFFKRLIKFMRGGVLRNWPIFCSVIYPDYESRGRF
jgi:hypothetical protein